MQLLPFVRRQCGAPGTYLFVQAIQLCMGGIGSIGKQLTAQVAAERTELVGGEPLFVENGVEKAEGSTDAARDQATDVTALLDRDLGDTRERSPALRRSFNVSLKTRGNRGNERDSVAAGKTGILGSGVANLLPNCTGTGVSLRTVAQVSLKLATGPRYLRCIGVR